MTPVKIESCSRSVIETDLLPDNVIAEHTKLLLPWKASRQQGLAKNLFFA